MSTHYIPPKGMAAVRLEKIESSLVEVLRPYITGRGKEKRLKEAVADVLRSMQPHMKLPKAPELGATVMTEAASMRNKAGNFTARPKQS